MKWWVITGLALVALLIALLGFRYVPRGQSHTVHRRGRFLRTLQPGARFVWPLLDRVIHKVDMKGRAVALHCPSLTSKDERVVVARGTLYFQILDARKVSDRLATLDQAAQQLAERSATEMVEQLAYDGLTSRTPGELSQWLLGMVNQSALQWGVRATRIDLDFKPGGKRRTTGRRPIVPSDPFDSAG